MKKLVSILLALILLLSAAGSALAADDDEPTTGEPATTEPEEPTTGEPEEPTTGDPDEPGEPEPTDVPGDADGSGDVTAADARLILRYAVDLEVFAAWQERNADLDEDGEVRASDARLALRLAVGLPLGETEEERRRREEREREEEERRREEEERQKQEEEERRKQEELLASQEGRMTELASRVNKENLAANMRTLVNDLSARALGAPQGDAAADWLERTLKGYGIDDVRRWSLTYDGKTGDNVVGVVHAARENPQILLFMAHYDTHLTTGGAVDNSSGVALMLELARILNSTELKSDYELRFLFTTGEEIGYIGAYRYIGYVSSSVGSAETFSRHAFVFNADMAGAPIVGGPWYLAVSTDSVLEDTFSGANRGSRAVDHAKTLLGDLGEAGYYSPVRAGNTDIHPFRKYGKECVNISWRQINPARANGSDYGLGTWEYIHTWTDSLENFNMTSLYNMTRLAAAAAAELAF
ncbi:MAG: M20/M25/M40 family metallo-hydrolase [Clostridia bacterium]|nr:M20/M25/M40 family metallo-hydrolase [Clostridia bacterium]